MKTIDEIKKKCTDNGLDINEVLRRANVPHDTKYNWDKKDPKPFETKRKIEETIERMSNEKVDSENSERVPSR